MWSVDQPSNCGIACYFIEAVYISGMPVRHDYQDVLGIAGRVHDIRSTVGDIRGRCLPIALIG